ncbi:MAG: hypothetical protein KAS32_22075, partial [Candidatus Peribacteraceae bacterium]|nr:hypothetical protein [Candidatus Peribacteraceae bacterium]
DEELQSLMMNVNARIEFVKLLSNKLKLVITPEELNELLKLAADHGVKSLIQEIDTRHEFANLLSHQLKLDIMPGVLDDLIKSAAEVSK